MLTGRLRRHAGKAIVVEVDLLPDGMLRIQADHNRMSVRNLRIIAWIEGVSYLVLLGVAMPLKYLADIPEAVRITGMMHGILFVLFSLALAVAWHRRRWSFLRSTIVFASSLIPCATFFMDRHLARWEAEPLPVRA